MSKLIFCGIFLLFLNFILPYHLNAESVSGEYKDYNVVVIIADSLRPDFLGCYGYKKNVSPNIDFLAHKGFVFINDFCQIPLTMPSVTSIFTSLYPDSHNTFHVFKDGVPKSVITLAEILKIYGYQTAWFGPLSDPQTGAAKGVLRGFDVCKTEANFIKEKEIITGVSFDNIFQWLRKQNKGRVFLVVHTYMPHVDNFPHYEFRNEFSKDVTDAYKQWKNMAVSFSKKDAYLAVDRHKGNFPAGEEEGIQLGYTIMRISKEKFEQRILGLDEEMFRQFLLYLDSAVFEMDRSLIGPLVKEIQENKFMKNTIVIITADHGDEHGEHRHLDHGEWLYDESIRVPLIFYLPGFTKVKKIDTLVQSIDILPTVLDLLKIPIPYQAQGMSLIGLMDGKEDIRGRQCVFSRSIDGKYMVRTREWKFIDNSNIKKQDELCNLKNDPQEQGNVILKNAVMAKNMQERLLGWRKNLPSYRDGTEQQFLPYIDKETQERIKKTGYW